MRIIFILFFLIIYWATSPCLAQAQFVLKGKINNQKEELLSYANVLIYDMRGDSLIAFDFTNEEGEYFISFELKPEAEYIAKIKYLGYSTLSWPFNLTTFYEDSIYVKNFVLSKGTFAIQEVLVRDKALPIVEKKDTIIYNADSFRDGSERNVEELLKKLPGIRINEKGMISYKGKSVSFVLLEGDQFFNRDYRIVTQNLSADIVEKVEAIEHYEDNPLLKGIIDSKKIALNLKLKKTTRKLFGEINLGGGYKNSFDGQTNLIHLYGKTKGLTLGSLNNIGQSASGFNDYVPSDPNQPNNLATIPRLSPLVNSTIRSPSQLNNNYYNFNFLRFAASQFIFRPNTKLKITPVYYLYADNLKRDYQTDERIFFGETSLNFSEITSSIQSPLNHTLQLLGNYTINNKSNLAYAGEVNFFSLTHQLNTERSVNDLLLSPVNTLLENRIFSVNQVLHYTKRINKDWAYVWDLAYSKQKVEQVFEVKNIAMNFFYNNDSTTISPFNQTINTPFNYFSFQNSFLFNKPKLFGELGLEWQSIKQSINSALFFNDNSPIIIDSIGFNNNKYTIKHLGVNLKFGLPSFIKAKLNSVISFQMKNLKSYESSTLPSKYFPVLNASLSASWKIKKQNTLLFSAAYNSAFSELKNYYENYILAGSYLFRRGYMNPAVTNSVTSTLLFSNNNLSKAQRFSAMIFYQKDLKSAITRLLINDNFFFTENDFKKTSNSFLLTSLSSSHYVSPLFGSIHFDFNTNLIKVESYVNQKLSNITNVIDFDVSGGYFSNFDLPLNFSFKYAYSTLFAPSLNSTTQNFTTQNLYFKLKLKPNKKFNAFLTIHQYWFTNATQIPRSFTMPEILANYTFFEGKFKLTIKGQNLLNRKFFEEGTISDYETVSQRFDLIPATILLYINYKF